MSARPWTGVTVISNANGRDSEVNPTFDVLEQLASQGVLRTNVTVYRVGRAFVSIIVLNHPRRAIAVLYVAR